MNFVGDVFEKREIWHRVGKIRQEHGIFDRNGNSLHADFLHRIEKCAHANQRLRIQQRGAAIPIRGQEFRGEGDGVIAACLERLVECRECGIEFGVARLKFRRH